MIPDILKIIFKFVGNQDFVSLDIYENVLAEFKMIYSPEVMEHLRKLARYDRIFDERLDIHGFLN